MRFNRFSIRGLMAVVMTTALCLAALRSATETTAGITLVVTCAMLGLAVVGAFCRDSSERAWWLGFVVFGWGYLALAFWSPAHETTLPTMTGLVAVCTKLGLSVPTVPAGRRQSAGIDPSFLRIGHYVCALIAASLGGFLGFALFQTPGLRSKSQADAASPEGRLRLPRRRKPTIIGLACLVLASLVVVIASRWAPPLWAGLAFLVTCVLLALAALGALLGKGLAREMWLGAALFGWGYMVLAFGWHSFHSACPYLVTSQWLDQFRPSFPPKLSGFPPCDDRTDPANARILSELEKAVPMHFRDETPLEDLRKHIERATAGSDGKGIPIYVDALGLQEAEVSMTSTFHIDAENVPLKATLRFSLRQLGLTYLIEDGFLEITSEIATDVEILQISENPFMIVGHSLFALLAAGFGAVAAPIVAGKRESQLLREETGTRNSGAACL